MNECMKGSGSAGTAVEGEVLWDEETGLNVVASVLHPPRWPLSCLVMPYHWPAKLKELPAPVAIATSTHGEMSQLFSLFPFSNGDRVSVFFFCIFFCLPLAHRPATFRQSLCTSALCLAGELALLNKNSAWNKWCNCLHRQGHVYSLTGSLALSPVSVLMYVSTQQWARKSFVPHWF